MDIKREIEKCELFIKNVFQYKGFNNAIIGISGGIDSAVIAALCCKALGPENVHGFLLPCGTQPDIKDSHLICDQLCIEHKVIDINNAVEALIRLDQSVMEFDATRVGNIKARTRMIVLYDQSAKYNGLVVGTSNLTELMLGYFTLHGDGACAIEPIGHLYKTEIKQVAVELGIPQQIIDKAPSAGLWEGQTDEEQIGASYETIDYVLKRYYRLITDMVNCRSFEPYETYELVDNIADNTVDIKIVDKIISMVKRNEFKSKPPTMMRR